MSKQRKKALITGITGQDGSYLCKSLLDKGFRVIGTSRKENPKCIKKTSPVHIIIHKLLAVKRAVLSILFICLI